jgi:hypothetical protein
LDEILSDLYSEGQQANKEIAEEIIKRLETQKNYIPSSDLARKEFAYVLLKDYKEYIESRTEKKQ